MQQRATRLAPAGVSRCDPTNKMIILMSWGASNCFLEEVMAHFGDRAGVSESAQGSWPTFSTDVKSAVFFIGQSTLSLITRLTGTLRTWRQRERERAELAQLSPAELHDIGVSSLDRWAEIHKPFWRE
jgi:uncharacterized protein YjiS (DUF1127 family)